MQYKFSSKTIFISLGILFVVIFSIGGIMSYFRWMEVDYFGEIMSVENGSFLIKMGGDAEKLILTSQDTVIRRGRKTVTKKLLVGDWVMVVGSLNKDGSVTARVVRVVSVSPRPPL